MSSNSPGFMLDFIVIGSRKAATTWLYENLSLHPDICISPKVKESHFFSRYFERGTSWYQSLFPDCMQGQLHGEIDAELITSPVAADNLAKAYPHVKIIVVLRNPADLFFSSYVHAYRKGDINGTPQATWENSAVFRREVSFAVLLEPFLQRFRKDQFLFMVFEDLQEDPEAFLGRIYEFLGVRLVWDQERMNTKVNVARLSYLPVVSHTLSRVARVARAADLHWFVNGVKSLGIHRLLDKSIKVEDGVAFPDELRRRILVENAEEIQQLERITGFNVATRWK